MARPRSNIAARLVVAARARFLAQGVDGASLRDIARDARTSLGMIHYYFPTKDDLFLAAVESGYGALARDVAAVMAVTDPLRERIRALYARVAQASTVELDVMRLVVREVLVSSERRRLIMERFLRGHIPPVLAALAQGQSTGELRPDRPLVALALSVLALGVFPQLLQRVAQNQRTPLPLLPPAELAEALAAVLLDGLAAPAAGRKKRPSRRSAS